jgi:hypothetical protein
MLALLHVKVGTTISVSRRACKPGSVHVSRLRAALRRSSLCDIRRRMPDATMCGKRAGRSRRRSGESLAVLLRVGFARPASLDAAGALLPHHFTLAKTRSRNLDRISAVCFCGTFLRVAPTGR